MKVEMKLKIKKIKKMKIVIKRKKKVIKKKVGNIWREM